ncbi:MAG: response regulator [Opitutales bacterium]
MKVLIVEDNVTMASALKYMLQQLGFANVVEVDDGADALSQLRQNRFDLVLLDWMLPSLSGVAISKWMRSNEVYHACPVIMVTVKDRYEDVLLAIESGVNEYVLKPLDRRTLQAKVESVLPGSTSRRAA